MFLFICILFLGSIINWFQCRCYLFLQRRQETNISAVERRRMRNTPPAPSMMNISVDDNTADAINKIRQLFQTSKTHGKTMCIAYKSLHSTVECGIPLFLSQGHLSKQGSFSHPKYIPLLHFISTSEMRTPHTNNGTFFCHIGAWIREVPL